MEKKTKSMKFVKAVLGVGALLAIAMPVFASDISDFGGAASGTQYGMPSQQDLQLLQMQGGMNYRHEEDFLRQQRQQQDSRQQYQEYADYGRTGSPSNQDVVDGYNPNGNYMQGGIQGADTQAVYVNSIEVSPSQILSREEVNKIVSPLVGKNVYISDLKNVVEQINKVYASRGFVTARAFLPEQTVQNGNIRIELVESKVGNVTVEQNRWTKSKYITDRMPQKEGELFDIVELEKDIMDFNRYNEGVTLTANLKAGEKEGTTDVELKAHEKLPFHVTGMMDNAGRYTTGRIRGGAMLQFDSLTGHRDKLSLGSYFSGGSTSPFADYNFPVNKHDGRVGFMFSSTFAKVKWGPYSPLDLKSRAYTYSLYYTQPLVRKPGFELKSYASLNYKRATSSMDLGTLFPGMGLGKYDMGTDDVTSVDVALNMRKDTKYGIWYLNQGVGYAAPIIGKESNYFKIFGGAVRLHDFSHGVIGQLRGNYQVIPNSKYIPYIDQFQAGGLATVRGYAEGSMIGKNGFFTSAELMFPLLPRQITSPRSGEKIPFIGKYVKGAVFGDFGGVFPQVGEYQYGVGGGTGHQGSYFMASVGMGLRVQLPGDLSARLYWGYPLINSTYFDQDRKVGRFHFELTMEPNFDALLRSRYKEVKATPQPAPQQPAPPPPEPMNNYDDIRHYDYFNDGGGGAL